MLLKESDLLRCNKSSTQCNESIIPFDARAKRPATNAPKARAGATGFSRSVEAPGLDETSRSF